MMAIRLMVSHYVAIYQHKLNKYLHIDCVKFIKTQNRGLELRFLFLFPKNAFIPTKKLFPQPLALLSPCGGIGSERLIEGGAQAAGMVHDERLSEPCMLSQTLNGILPENDVSPPHPNPLPQGARGSDRRMPRLRQTTKKPQPNGCGFLLAQPVGASSATGLRRGASWSCRRCLPARYPSR